MNTSNPKSLLDEVEVLKGNLDHLTEKHPLVGVALGSIISQLKTKKSDREGQIFGASASIIGVLSNDIEKLHQEVEQLRTVVNNLAGLIADK